MGVVTLSQAAATIDAHSLSAPCAKPAPALRRGTSWEERAIGADEAAIETGAPLHDQAPAGVSLLTVGEFAAKSLALLYSNPEGSYAPDVPRVRLDAAMAVSCASLFPLGLVYYSLGQAYLFHMISVLTVTSVLADAVFHNSRFFDLLDRYWATTCVCAIVHYAFSFLGGLPASPSPLWLLAAVPVQLALLLAPLSCLKKSRSFAIGSEEWRKAHARWHYVAAVCCSLTAVVSSHLSGGSVAFPPPF
uniref:Uncharacterized protein n=1 Tax=Hemiselmis tepida TaxID=464990 RepID=A0A7S0VZE7_9CRYP|mmetsp:Transcript_30126/g.76351  ORF Transcript_30126/g.76351 Transcript_30126/m.76351 type:complete len:247 (+) Transcript_30126:37-777(+)